MSSSGPPSESTPTESGSEERPFAWGKSLNHSAGIVGVDDELDRVRALLEAARGGSTQSLLVEGEPGIGKTTLLEAAQRMATGYRCLWVRGIESEAVLGHAGLLQLLGPIRDRLDEIPGAQADALSSALGWGAAPAPADRFLVAAATLSMLAAESEPQPVLVLVDDLQWVDRESAAALGFAARRLSEDAVCFLWAARTGSVPPDIAQGLPSFALHGLSGKAAQALVGDRLTSDVVGRLVDATGGNPLGMLEVTRQLSDAQRVGAAALPEPLPVGDRLGLVYEQVLADLSAPAWMATVLYALNRSGSFATVATALAAQGVDATAAVDEALDREVLVRDGPAISFRHPLLRAAALSLATPTQQRAAHRALADALAGDPDSPARVWHRSEAVTAPDDELAADLVRVADRSRTGQGHAAASAALERAALLTGDASIRADRLAAASVDAFLAGDVDRTRALAGQVLDGSPVGPARAQAQFALGTLEQYAGSVPRAADLLGEAVELLAGAELVRALTELALIRFRLNDVAGIGECAGRIGPAAQPDDPEQRMLSSFTLGLSAILDGDHATGRELLTEVIDLVAGPELVDDPRSLLFLTLAAGFVGDPRAVMAVGERRLAEVRERGAIGVLVPALALTAAGRAWVGDHVGAYADAGEAAELGEQLGFAADTAVAIEMLAEQSASRGLHDDARAALERAKVLTDRAGTTQFAAHQAVTAAFCALCRSDPAETVALLEARLAIDGGVGAMGEPLGVAPDLVEAYVALGRRADADELTERFAAVTPPTAAPTVRALVARCRGLSAEDDGLATQSFELALAAHAEAPDVLELARTQLLYGARLRRGAERVKAREHLARARDAFVAMDLTAWATRAADELAATGANPRRRELQATEPLTSQETRVALHAAKGLSNREIAAALFLSPKTIERHLSSVYRKRGFRSRTELAASFRAPEID